jgi:hypothetical protein
MINRAFLIVCALAGILLAVNVVQFSLLREQGKKISMMEAANESLTKELSAVNRRIVLFTRARNEGRQFKIDVSDENEKNRDWAGDAVPVSVINRLCTKINCAEPELQVPAPVDQDKKQR